MFRTILSGLLLCLSTAASATDPAAPIPVQAFFSFSKVTAVKISPDGKCLAMVVADDDSGEDQKFVTVIGTDDRKIKTSFKVADGHQVENFWWANNQRILIATDVQTDALSLGVPDGALYAINVDQSQSLQLLGEKPVKNSGKTHMFDGLLFLPHDASGHILVRTDEDDDGHPQVLDVDIYSGEAKVVMKSPVKGGGFQRDSKGDVRLAYGENLRTGAPELYYRDPAKDAKWKDLSDLYEGIDEADDDSGPAGITPDGEGIYWRGRTQAGTMGLFRVNPKTLQRETLFADPEFDIEWEVYGDRADNEDKILAVETIPGLPQMHVIDPKDPETVILQQLQQAFSGQESFITSSTSDGTLMVVFVTSDKNPGDYYLFNGKTLKADYLFSRLEQIDPDQMSAMQPVTIKARDGVVLHGYLTKPAAPAGKKLPLIVLPHGGPHGVHDTWGWDREVQYLAYHGYAVLQVNYRGSNGYGQKFQDLGYRNWGTTMQDDLADSVQWAEQQQNIDPARVCTYGASYGGYAALENVIRYPALYKCAIGYVGVYDLTLQAKYSDTRRSASGRNYLDIVLGDDKQELEKYSPAYNADKIQVPVFIAYGGKDQRVVPENAKELMAAMDKIGKHYDSMFEPYEAHGFIKPEHKYELYTRILQFLDANIGIAQPSAPAKAH